MTQKERIINFLDKQQSISYRPIELSKILNIPAPSVRRALFHLRKENLVSKPRISRMVNIKQKGIDYLKEKLRPKEPEEEEWRRKIVKASFRQTQDYSPYALTFERNKIDRAVWLIDQISFETNPRIGDAKINKNIEIGIDGFNPSIAKKAVTWGYDDKQTTDKTPKKRLQYPLFQAGFE